MKTIKVNIVNADGVRTSTTVNSRMAQTYVKLVHMTANKELAIKDVIKAVEYLALNGREGITAPTTQAELIDAMATLIENTYYDCWHALRETTEPSKGYVPTEATLAIRAKRMKELGWQRLIDA